MYHKKIAIAFIAFIMFFLPVCNIVHGATEYCLDNSTLRTIIDYTVDGSNTTQFNITKGMPCPYGCDSSLNACLPSPLSQILILVGIGLFILFIIFIIRKIVGR
jgi:hypothetical protein